MLNSIPKKYYRKKTPRFKNIEKNSSDYKLKFNTHIGNFFIQPAYNRKIIQKYKIIFITNLDNQSVLMRVENSVVN